MKKYIALFLILFSVNSLAAVNGKWFDFHTGAINLNRVSYISESCELGAIYFWNSFADTRSEKFALRVDVDYCEEAFARILDFLDNDDSYLGY